MTNSISSAIYGLITAVKPVARIEPAQIPQPEVRQAGKVNTFALGVLTNVLEAQVSLLDDKSHDQDASTVVNAATALAAYQQTVALTEKVNIPTVDIKV